jgi:hypothetical protein
MSRLFGNLGGVVVVSGAAVVDFGKFIQSLMPRVLRKRNSPATSEFGSDSEEAIEIAAISTEIKKNFGIFQVS